MKAVACRTFAVMCLVLSGCAHMVESQKIPPRSATEAAPLKGTVYFLPKHLVKIVVNGGDQDKPLAVLPAVPDMNFGFVAKLNHVGSSNDHIEVSTTPDGLLTEIKGQTEDETGDIILKLAEAAVEVAKLVAGGGYSALAFPAAEPRFPQARREFIFDPLQQDELARVRSELKTLGYDYRIVAADHWEDVIENEANLRTIPAKIEDGIVYRRARAYVMTLSRTNGEDLLSLTSPLAQGGPIAVLPLERGAFTKSEYGMTFDNGLLTKTEITRPSEVLGAVSIIPNTLKTIASIPAEIIKLRIDYSSQNTELIEAQQKLLEAQKALEDQLKALQKNKPSNGNEPAGIK